MRVILFCFWALSVVWVQKQFDIYRIAGKLRDVYPTDGLQQLPNNCETIISEVLFVLYSQTHTGMSDVSMWFILGLLWHCRLLWRLTFTNMWWEMINGAIVQLKVSDPFIIITWHVILFNPLSDLFEKVSLTWSCVFLTRYTASHERTFVFLFFFTDLSNSHV